MPYTATNWVDNVTLGTHVNMNNLETQYTEATLSLNQDVSNASPFVLSGLACVKDTTTANKLNVGAGVAYLLQTDNTLRRRAPAFSTQTTSTVSTTYYLYLQPDGSWYWSTANTPAANSLPICSVTTDSSGNISGVTDARVFTLKLLTGGVSPSVKTPALQLPAPISAVLTQSAPNYGAVNGGVTFGQVGALAASMDQSALFNGTSGYITMPTSGLPTGAGPWSLEAWVYVTAAPAGNAIVIQLGTATNDKQAQIGMIANTTTVTASLWSDDTAASSPISLNAWHQLVATYDGATLKLYVDAGTPLTKATTAGNLTYGMATIGASFVSGSYVNFFGGRIDEVAIYNTALSATRITAHYNAATSTTSDAYATTVLSDNPLRYYRLGDAGGSTVALCTTSPTPTTVLDAGGNLSPAGRLTTLAGQATAGSFGAPVIVAQATGVSVTTTSQATLISGTFPAGLYRLSGYVSVGGSGSHTVTGTIDDGFIGAQWSWRLSPSNAQSTAVVVANGSILSDNYVIMAQSIWHTGAHTLSVYYQNTTGTPNDTVTVILERLS